MDRIIFMVLRNIYRAPFWFYRVLKMGREDAACTEQERYGYIRRMVEEINRTGRVTIRVQGRENLPEQDGFILFPNHQGLFDALALIEASPHPFGVVIKKEAAGIILVKQVVRALRGIAIDREDMKDSVRMIRQVAEEVKAGRNYVIFAEGTRSRRGNELLPFKGGTFKSAVKARCPIVPVALIDSYRPFDERGIARREVQVHFLPPLYPDQYIDMKTNQIADLVHDQIQEKINQNIP